MYIKVIGAEIESFSGKEVILFGCGSGGLRALEEFEQIGARIVGFTDNNKNLIGTEFCGYQIISPESLPSYVDSNIIIASSYEDEIEKQLQQMKLTNYYKIKLGVLKEKKPFKKFQNQTINNDDVNKIIYNALVSKAPFFIGRLGSVELECLAHYLYFLERNRTKAKTYPNNVKMMMHINAGFFPPEDNKLDMFCELYMHGLENMDLIWSMWMSVYEDKIYSDYFHNKKVCNYDETVFPIDNKMPWTYALRDKRVLVIHPFADSIQSNYRIKNRLFDNDLFLPDFELLTYKPIQSIAGNKTNYETWFEALEKMNKDISEIDFDIALIGAGAYGLSLGTYIKELGKKAVHIGGILQLFFGIRGKAWDKYNYHNIYWTRPLDSERPKGYKKVEAGRYW